MSPTSNERLPPLHVVAKQVHYYCHHIGLRLEAVLDLLENDSANRARDITKRSQPAGRGNTRNSLPLTHSGPDADIVQAIQSIVRLKHVVSCLAWLPSAGHVHDEFATIVDQFWKETHKSLNAIEVDLSVLQDNGSRFNGPIAQLKELNQLHHSLSAYSLSVLDGHDAKPDISDVKRFAALQDSSQKKSGWTPLDPADKKLMNRLITRRTIAMLVGLDPRSLEHYYPTKTNSPAKKRLPEPEGNRGKAAVYRLAKIVEWAKKIDRPITSIPVDLETFSGD